MAVPLVALIAAAMYQVRSPLADSESPTRTLRLMVEASGGDPLTLEVGESDLRVNGDPVSLLAPGATIVRQALIDHGALRLGLPASMTLAQWREIVDLLAAAPGLYASVDDLRDALRTTVPEIVISATAGTAAEADLREALFELPGLRAAATGAEPVRAADPHQAELAALAARLDPLLQAAVDARDRQDYPRLAQLLIQIHELEDGSNDELRTIVARERRRVIPPAVLDSLARLIPKPGISPAIGRVIASLGREGADALFSALHGAPGPHERRAYLDVLVAAPECDDAIIEVLSRPAASGMRDAAEIAGRKQLERAVPTLAHLLKHPDAEIRTAAWRALELISTPAALRALRS